MHFASYHSFLYHSYYHDRDLYYLGANGDLNRCNLYAYCSNNQAMYVDPSGHFIVLLFALLLGVALGAGLGAAGSIADTAIDGESNVGNYVLKAIEGATLGAFAGWIGGSGSASKYVTNSFKRVLKNRNWSYYFTQIKTQAWNDGLKAIPSIIKATIPTITKTTIKTCVQQEWY